MNKIQALLDKSNAIRSLVKILRQKRANYLARCEGAAIDIASLLLAALALSIVATVIATTTFVVVPWAQDEAAKNQLKSVMAAQQVYAGMEATENQSGQQVGALSVLKTTSSSVGSNTHNTSKHYGDLTDLIRAGLFDPAFKPSDADDAVYGEQMLSNDKYLCVVKVEYGEGYETAILSASGNVFAATESHTSPVKLPPTEDVCKGRVLGEYQDSENVVVIPPTSGTLNGEETTPSPSPSPTSAPVTPEKAPEPPAQNKDPKTKEFMFCHHGEMHSNSFNGMIHGHHGHDEDIMPPIPFKNYVGWNWNEKTAKIFYNNCQPVTS